VEIRRRRKRRRFRDVQESSSGDAGGATCSCCCFLQHLPRLDVEKRIILIERERESDPSVALDNTQLGFFLASSGWICFLLVGFIPFQKLL